MYAQRRVQFVRIQKEEGFVDRPALASCESRFERLSMKSSEATSLSNSFIVAGEPTNFRVGEGPAGVFGRLLSRKLQPRPLFGPVVRNIIGLNRSGGMEDEGAVFAVHLDLHLDRPMETQSPD